MRAYCQNDLNLKAYVPPVLRNLRAESISRQLVEGQTKYSLVKFIYLQAELLQKNPNITYNNQ